MHGGCFRRSGRRLIIRPGATSATGRQANTRCGNAASGSHHRCPPWPLVRRSGSRDAETARYRPGFNRRKPPAYAYTGATNTAFLRAGGNVDEYTAGQKYAAAQKWLEVDRSGTRIVLLPDGAE
jgi:hypothetical protein